MAEAIKSFSLSNFHSPSSSILHRQQSSSTRLTPGWLCLSREGKNNKRRGNLCGRVNALPDWPLMAVMVQQIEGQRDFITHKSVWHLSDQAIKNVYMFYIMFTCWGCMFFGSTKDPYYDSEAYRGDGGDGTGHWIYEKQEDMEESARAELLREELIEEIEQKANALRELEEAVRR